MAASPAQNYEQFGKYVLLEKIAAGGMAEVYLAKSAVANGLNKFVAVKRILPQFSQNEEFVDMFKEEAKVAINLNHGNIVSIYDFGVEKQQFFLVMEFMEGRNLRQVINELKKNNKSFSMDQSVFMIKEVAAGLDHAHRCVDANSGRPLNITHRDMSPQNIMISFEGEVKVIDFGIAKAETEKEETKAGTLKGKFSYMSPEQAEGQPIDPRTDVFALGIVLWELLANDRLFTGSNEATILRKVRECQIPQIRKVNPLVPQELERIVMKALAKDKNVRYQTAANLHRDLNRFLNTQFPDFSVHDFSGSLKESFRGAFAEAREKLILYSKVDLTPVAAPVNEATLTANGRASTDETLPPPDRTPFPPASTENEAPAPSPYRNKMRAEGPPSGPPAPEHRPAPSSSKPTADVPPSFADQLRPTLEGVRASFIAKQPAAAPSGKGPLKPLSNGSIHHTKVSTQISKSHPKQVSSGGSEFFELAFKMIVLCALVGGGYYGYKNKFGQGAELTPSGVVNKLVPPLADTKVESGNIESAGLASVKASISSTPPGAQIYLDGKDMGYRTPAVITLTANKDSIIGLKKDGYLTYEVTKQLSQTGQITATLQPAAQAGFVNISVANGGPSTIIYVNGKELSEKAPIMKYSILADNEATIRAYNPITKQSDQIKVKVRTNENRNVEMILGRIPVKK
ncbi:MAG: serine/threonine protein kinase [Bdellovibrio sp.]|nr:serine/threonine protein kinase [Bdellovibrio sp.]